MTQDVSTRREQRIAALEGMIRALEKLEDRHPEDRQVILDALEATMPLLTLDPGGGRARHGLGLAA